MAANFSKIQKISHPSSPSSSSSSTPAAPHRWTYDVFLSFRGEDTRKTFVDHLYSALDQKGIYTYKDDITLVRGHAIQTHLFKSIEQSKFALIIFSQNYAESAWCLDELAKIVECYNAGIGQVVLPVFYGVNPSDVRKQRGYFGEVFAKHGMGDRVQVWRNALMEASNLSGWDVNEIANGHEAECIKDIVKRIWSELPHLHASADENLVGIGPRLCAVKSLLRVESSDVLMIGIWGMGGAGKTTIAREVFYDIAYQFEGTCFVENIRENSQKTGLQLLQKKVISDILKDKNLEVSDVDGGKRMIRTRLCQKKVLIVLDDVDHTSQLDALAGSLNWFGKGSRIIITTRDEQLLQVPRVRVIHSIDLLSDNEAFHLFKRHAFEGNSPEKEYDELSLRVVRYAAGLPLVLRVLGSYLCGRGINEWKSALARLKEIPEKQTVQTLKISYDDLEDDEKEIFLDIACLFKGWHKDRVYEILDSCGFHSKIGVDVLVRKSLITISPKYETFEMHDLIQEMGSYIVRQETPGETGRQSRLWCGEEVRDVVLENIGLEAIKAIVLDELCESEATFLDFSEAFARMKKLRILHVKHVMNGHQGGITLQNLPNELRWLTWESYAEHYLAKNFGAKKLVVLEMPRSKLVYLWTGMKLLDKLKVLDLSDSNTLFITPDFTGCPNLERLILEGCRKLKDVHPSIGVLEKLVFVDLKKCTSLESFPSNGRIWMKSLEILCLSSCRKLKLFPEVVGNMDRLSKLYLDNTAIHGLPSSIGNFKNLVLLSLKSCANLTGLPDTIWRLTRLETLDLGECIRLEKIPDVGPMELVQELTSDLTCTGNLKVNTGVSSLRRLFLKKCNLSVIPSYIGILSSLEELDLRCSKKLSHLPLSISQLSRLKLLLLSGCEKLEELPDLPFSIAVLEIDSCISLKSLACLSTKHKCLWKVSGNNCRGLLEGGLYASTTIIADMVLKIMLQGYAMNHQFGMCLPAMDIPQWFKPQVEGKEKVVLQMPPNWHNKIIGVALHTIHHNKDDNGYLQLTLSHTNILPPENESFPPQRYYYNNNHLAPPQMILGYISFHLLECSSKMAQADWFNTSSPLFLSVHKYDASHIGCRLVHKEEAKWMSSVDSSGFELDQLFGIWSTPRCFKVDGGNGLFFSLHLHQQFYLGTGPDSRTF